MVVLLPSWRSIGRRPSLTVGPVYRVEGGGQRTKRRRFEGHVWIAQFTREGPFPSSFPAFAHPPTPLRGREFVPIIGLVPREQAGARVRSVCRKPHRSGGHAEGPPRLRPDRLASGRRACRHP